MNDDVEQIGTYLKVTQSVDRKVLAFMMRALLLDASPAKVQACREMLGVVRSMYESLPELGAETDTGEQSRLALHHFESWELEMEHMLQERMNGFT